MAVLAIAAAAALTAQTVTAWERAPDLGWMAGYWLSCAEGREVSESWSDARGTTMLGTSLTVYANGDSTFEQMRIAFDGSRAEGWQAFLIAQPAGQPATTFRLARFGPGEAVFENSEHDFPQRIIYRRAGETLTARIEGSRGDEPRAAEWRYRAAPLNSRCDTQPAAENR